MVCVPVRRDNPQALASGLYLRTGGQTMLYLTCIMISSVLYVTGHLVLKSFGIREL